MPELVNAMPFSCDRARPGGCCRMICRHREAIRRRYVSEADRQTVYSSLRRWQREGVWNQVHHSLAMMDREHVGREASGYSSQATQPPPCTNAVHHRIWQEQGLLMSRRQTNSTKPEPAFQRAMADASCHAA